MKTNKAIKKVNKIFNKTLKSIKKQKGIKKVSEQQKIELAFSLTQHIINEAR